MLISNTLSLIFVIFFVISVVVEVAVLVGLLITVLKVVAKVNSLLDAAKTKALPLVGDAHAIVQDLQPKIKTISGHLVEISTTVRDQTKHVNTTVDDVVGKTRAQAGKVDEMVSAVLDGLTHAGSTVSAGVAKPVRKVSSILHGIRVGLDTLFENRPAAHRNGGPVHPAAAVVDETIQPPPIVSSPS